jgi:cytidylate kinase
MTLKSKAFDFNNNFIVTIDGPAGSGKGTIGKLLAQKFKLLYYQSSILYRNLAISCINQKINPTNIDEVIELSRIPQNAQNAELGNEDVAMMASAIAIIPEVRNNLGKFLINLIQTTPRIVMEGRDIGTVIAPQADLKIFIRADVEIRAKRRYKELRNKGKKCIMSDILAQLKARDKKDIERTIAPLSVPKDSLEIDTSYLSPTEVINKIEEFISVR